MSRPRPPVSTAIATALTVCATLVLSSSSVIASDWASWRGPNQNGSADSGRGLLSKGETAPKLNVTWNRPLGKAYSGIAVVDGKLVTMFADAETDWLIALDAASGKELWRYKVDATFPKVGGSDGGQNGMPVVDGGTVYGLGAKGQLFAVELATGKEIWTVRVDEKLGGKQPYFGFATTPLVVDDVLVVQTGGSEGHSLTGLDKKTGKVLWASGDEVVGYQSPVLVTVATRRQVIATTNKSVMGIEPKDGTALWRAEHGLVPSRDGWSTALPAGDDGLFLSGNEESVFYKVSKTETGFGIAETWRGKTLKGNFALPVVHDGYLYGFTDDALACVEIATGKALWTTDSQAAGLILVDGQLVILAADGNLIVAAASPKGFEERARVAVMEKSGFTFPSFAGGGIFVRNQTHIARVDVGVASR